MALLATVGCALLAGSAATPAGAATPPTTPAPTVTGYPPQVGTMLTATPVSPGDQIDWATCDASGTPASTYLATNTPTYTLASSDIGGYVCAVEQTSPPGTPYVSSPIGLVGVGPTLSTSGPLQQGQTLTVTHGAWGSGAAISDVWEDCDSTGANCQQISGATSSSYTVTRSDANQTIDVVETGTLNGASASDPTAPTGLATATPPSNNTRPAVSGTPQVGDTLIASPGSWTNNPTGYAYSWERCSGAMCTAIPSATGQTYVVTPADVGDVLDVLVTASVFSSQGSPYPSFPTNAVVAAPVTTPPVTTPPVTTPPVSTPPVSTPPVTTPPVSGPIAPPVSGPPPITHTRSSKKVLGRITALMEWTFRYTPSYAQVIALVARGVTVGARVTVRCSGKGCPFRRLRITVAKRKRCRSASTHACRAPRTVNLGPRFRGRDLRIGARITITITRRRYVGKYYRFAVRARKQPTVRISCLAPGARTPGKPCTRS